MRSCLLLQIIHNFRSSLVKRLDLDRLSADKWISALSSMKNLSHVYEHATLKFEDGVKHDARDLNDYPSQNFCHLLGHDHDHVRDGAIRSSAGV